MDQPAHEGSLDNPAVSHELSDVPLRGLLVFFAFLVVAAIVIHFMVWMLMMALEGPGPPERGQARPFVAQPGAPPPGPQFERLLPASGVPIQQVDPAEELRRFRQREQARLRAWGWQESADGLALPVDRALDALAARGVPVERSPGVERR